jgi:predicted RNase H-like nuclease
MIATAKEEWLAGVDGCPGGWIAAFVRPVSGEVRIAVVPRFADVLAAPERAVVVAVDMPIGLPDWGGRDAEVTIRRELGRRKRTVFPVPSRNAVYAETGIAATPDERRLAHQRACAVAAATSRPSKRIPIQTFSIFPKIREIDALLRADAALVPRVFEVHPELAFWRLNGERALGEPKKVKSRCHEPGLALRRGLLIAAGLPPNVVNAVPPKGAGPDDLLDALACAAVAQRVSAGIARPFPDPPPRDACGLPMAIWA